MPNHHASRSPGREGPSIEIQVTRRSIASLLPDPKNPRRHSLRQVRQIARSIETFGFLVPVLVDRAGNVIAGHGRLLACQELGWSEVPTITLEHLTEAQAKAYMLADNRLTEVSSWDDRLLAEQLKDLSLANLDFNLEVIGFDMGEIDLLIEGLEEDPLERDRDDELPPLADGVVSRPGDLWALGPHRILCGNSLTAGSYQRLLGDEQANLVFTDPPYNVPIDGHVGGLGKVHHREFEMAAGEMSMAEFTDFLKTATGLMAKHSREGSLHYLCIDWRHVGELLAAGAASYGELKNLCVWVKDCAGMGSFYRSQHELVLVFKKGTTAHQNHVQLGRFGRTRTNVWRYPGVNSFGGRSTEEGNLLALHPTVKPVALVADAIKDASSRSEIVLDPFLGSGTTLIAAERTGRVCRGIEMDPRYVDTAIRRWQTLTNQRAFHIGTGRTFDDLQARAEANEPPEHQAGAMPDQPPSRPEASVTFRGEGLEGGGEA